MLLGHAHLSTTRRYLKPHLDQTLQHARQLGVLRVADSQRLDLTQDEEEEAFWAWAWAIVETLRRTGPRGVSGTRRGNNGDAAGMVVTLRRSRL
jgi:hypothetical protein